MWLKRRKTFQLPVYVYYVQENFIKKQPLKKFGILCA